MQKKNIIVGSLFIIFGIILGINLLTDLDFEFWPLFILIPGIVFEVSYFNSRGKASPGLLVPGGILIVIGILFFIETLTKWEYTAYTWPVYMLAVAVGLFQLYVFGKKDKGLLIPISILAGLFVIFTVGNLTAIKEYFMYIGPSVIIIIGIVIIFAGRSARSMEIGQATEDNEPQLIPKDKKES